MSLHFGILLTLQLSRSSVHTLDNSWKNKTTSDTVTPYREEDTSRFSSPPLFFKNYYFFSYRCSPGKSGARVRIFYARLSNDSEAGERRWKRDAGKKIHRKLRTERPGQSGLRFFSGPIHYEVNKVFLFLLLLSCVASYFHPCCWSGWGLTPVRNSAVHSVTKKWKGR